MPWFEFESRIFLWFYYLYLVRMENHVCLSHGVQVAGAAWWAVMRIMVGVGDLLQRIRNSHTGQVLNGQTIRTPGDTVCSLHHARGDEERRFLG
jgi:hypothetical protein